MKVAVSIPDDVFAEAEILAKRFKTSRSQIYSRALGAFIDQHCVDQVTARLDAVVEAIGPEGDPVTKAASRQVAKHSEW